MYTMPSCIRHDLDRHVSEPELAQLRRTGADIVDATGRCRDNEQVSRVARTVDIDVEAAGCEYLTCAHQGIVAMPALIDPVRRSGVIRAFVAPTLRRVGGTAARCVAHARASCTSGSTSFRAPRR